MKVFFLSDLHIHSGDDPTASRFVQFLRSEPSPGDLLVLGGDIFDLLVGSKRVFRARFAPVLEALRDCTNRGVRLHYLEGNHDFHFAGIFRGFINVTVHRKDFELEAHGHRIWVSHGDLIDREDKGYLFLRAATKNLPFRVFVKAMPGALVDWIGSRSSGASRKYTTERVENEGTARLRKIYLDFAREKVREGYRHVLVGHSHLQDQVELGGGEYVNLGFSAEKLLVAVLEKGMERFGIRELV